MRHDNINSTWTFLFFFFFFIKYEWLFLSNVLFLFISTSGRKNEIKKLSKDEINDKPIRTFKEKHLLSGAYNNVLKIKAALAKFEMTDCFLTNSVEDYSQNSYRYDSFVPETKQAAKASVKASNANSQNFPPIKNIILVNNIRNWENKIDFL